MTAVLSQPSSLSRSDGVSCPITSGRDASSIMTAMIGTEITPLITALHNNALMGSIGKKFRATPASVDTAMIA